MPSDPFSLTEYTAKTISSEDKYTRTSECGTSVEKVSETNVFVILISENLPERFSGYEPFSGGKSHCVR